MTGIFFVLILIFIDQISKYFVTINLAGKGAKEIIPGILEFCYLENRGAAFGMLQEQRWLFILVTIFVVIFIIYVLFHYSFKQKLIKVSLLLILSGTIGNFIDRIRLHYVVDFIKMKIFGYNFAIFNLADSFIVIGTILLIFFILKDAKE